ncbi:hypothetical protein Lepto782_24160 (plasmid) [Leptospira interrogans serovar Canicola]|uniref:Uncharacterized protein n=2 Tax=Leptospira interrogans TaxID=173 RepID=A0AAP9WGJ7_LEPIR|nr:hypothetical protein Lepto782_24160 [Leptospira interrogans serovar Canicola]QOI53287.1 hypothetical protein Lepto1489_23195 [Leptospira interrogans serovar Bataviae]QOI53372.1 hypothetical protein Lepto1489_23800 [Leptospira interrogans serovar Bataviae]
MEPNFQLRQNGAPSGLEKRGLDASIYHKIKKPTEGTKVKRKICRNGWRPVRFSLSEKHTFCK